MFKNRTDAGIQLAKKLVKFKNENIVVLAIPKGGLPLGAIIAKTLNAPLDVVLTKKIGHPFQKEYAIGAVSLEDIILTEDKAITKSYIDKETARIREKLKEQYDQYYKDRPPESLKDKTIIIVDDGIATGNTLMATIKLVSKQTPTKVIVAIPVAPSTAIHRLENNPDVSKVICLLVPNNFQAVGQFYEEFHQVSSQEAIQLLIEANAPTKSGL